MPSVLGSGGDLIVDLTGGELLLGAAALTLVVKFLFSAVSFGSGAPGGIFFPLLVLGALIGGIFAMACVELFGLDPVYINNFVLLAMAGYFTAIVRAPITGIILLFEMSGTVSQMLSLAVVSVAEERSSRGGRARRKRDDSARENTASGRGSPDCDDR